MGLKREPGNIMDNRGNRKQLTGIVLMDKMDKTARVMVERLAKHKKYKKFIRYRKQYLITGK